MTHGATLASRPRSDWLVLSLFNASACRRRACCGCSRARPIKATKSRSPAPLRQAERLRRPFQESARRDFEPLAPNLL